MSGIACLKILNTPHQKIHAHQCILYWWKGI